MHAFLYMGLQSSVASLLRSGAQSIAFDLEKKSSAHTSPRSVIVRTDSEPDNMMELHNVMTAAQEDSSRAADVYLCVQTKSETQPIVNIDAYHSRDGVDFELHHPSETPRGTTNWTMWRWRQPRLGILKLVIAPGDRSGRVNYVACAMSCVQETAPCNAEANRASTLEVLMPPRSSHRDPWILNEVSVYASDSVDGEARLIQPLSITVMHGTDIVACFNPLSLFNPGLYGLKQFPTGASLCAQDN